MSAENERKEWGLRLLSAIKDPELGARFAQWLTAKRVRSFSPETGMMLVEIQRQLDALREDCPPELEPLRGMYSGALMLVAQVGCAHQGAVIANLERFMESAKK